jgi:hypothetical protein
MTASASTSSTSRDGTLTMVRNGMATGEKWVVAGEIK